MAELELALAGRAGTGDVILGLASEIAEATLLRDQGLVAAGVFDSTRDAYAVLQHAGKLYVLGSTPRGLLHAVFSLHEAMRAGMELNDNLRLAGTLHFRERIFHPRFQPWPGQRADVRAIAHLGATHCLVSHDWQGSRRSLQGCVTSPLFPKAVDPVEVQANHAGLRRLLDDCADYGLGAMLWLTELPCQGGPWVPAEERERFLTRYDNEVLSDSGTYEGKVLCFGHERVQAFYRDLVRRFFADFPEIETLFVFGLDSGGEFCDPQTCPRCHGLSRLAQRDRLVCFLIDEGRKARPGLRVLTTGWKWDRDGETFLKHQAALPAASGVYLAAQKDGWQCERQSHDFMRAVRHVCRAHGQTFIGYDNFHWGDDTVHGLGDIQDFPLGIGAKLRRWRELGADGVFDHWGHAPEDIWCNSIACREFFLNPRADIPTVVRRLANRQFGHVTGAHVFAAWLAIEEAHAALSPACIWSPGQWPGWYEGCQHLPLPGEFRDESLRAHQSPQRADGDRHYNPADFAASLQTVADAWAGATPPYIRAAACLQTALVTADDDPLGYQFWWNGPTSSPTRREHVRRQLLHVESMLHAGREIGLHFGLHALWERTGRVAEVYRRLAAPLLREDVTACQAAAAFFRTQGKPEAWSSLYDAKAARLDAWLGDTD